ncbi:MAG: cysteine hydrolase [Sulfuricella sp.]|nr:cysteine hydrolase [Sulfuricella sp.]
MTKTVLLLIVALAQPLACRAADTPPPTLLQIAGVRLPEAKLSDSVLLIIDAQREYTDGRLPLTGIDAAILETALLLKRARHAGTPVIHIVHHGKPGGALFDPAGPFVNIVPQLAPLPGETIIVKSLPNSFAATGLEKRLTELGRKNLLVVGFMTHMCVSATVRAALDLGYRNTIVAGATAERDLPDGAGGSVSAAQLQKAELAALADRFAAIVPHADEIAEH